MVGLITSICADLATSSSTHARRCWTPASRAIHFEYFRAGQDPVQRRTPDLKPVQVAPTAGAGVVAVVDGVRHIFRVPEGGLVVDVALSAGIRVPYSCKGGMCCTCRAKPRRG